MKVYVRVEFDEFLRLSKIEELDPSAHAQFAIEAALDATHGDAREALDAITESNVVTPEAKAIAAEVLEAQL